VTLDQIIIKILRNIRIGGCQSASERYLYCIWRYCKLIGGFDKLYISL